MKTKECTLNLQEHELRVIIRALCMMNARAERIDHILDHECTKEFHNNSVGILNDTGVKLLHENIGIKMTLADITRKIKEIL